MQTLNTLNKAAYGISEAATLMGIGRTMLYREINEGRLQARKVGRRTIIPASSIHEWLEALPPVSA